MEPQTGLGTDRQASVPEGNLSLGPLLSNSSDIAELCCVMLPSSSTGSSHLIDLNEFGQGSVILMDHWIELEAAVAQMAAVLQQTAECTTNTYEWS